MKDLCRQVEQRTKARTYTKEEILNVIDDIMFETDFDLFQNTHYTDDEDVVYSVTDDKVTGTFGTYVQESDAFTKFNMKIRVHNFEKYGWTLEECSRSKFVLKRIN